MPNPTWTAHLDYDTLLICEEKSGLEIPIRDFDSAKAVPSTLSEAVISDDITLLGIKYPLGEGEQDGFGQPLYLEVIIVGNDQRRDAKLHYGAHISWAIPVEFAEQLQAQLLLEAAHV